MIIDKVIATISPKWALERAQYKRAFDIVNARKRKYDGATKGRRTEGWITNGNDANQEINSGYITLRNRSRDLCRNNPYAINAVSTIVSEVVGSGIMGKVNGAESFETKRLNQVWKEWAGSTKADADGIFNFYGLQALVMGSQVESGFVFARRVYPKSTEYLGVPLKIQILESDFLDLDKHENLANGGKIRQGIEFNKQGKRVAYWLFNTHPGSCEVSISSRIPAEDVIQIFRPKRPGQMLDVPWVTPVILTLNDLDGFEDAQLLKQKISACFVAFRRTPDAINNTLLGEGGNVTDKVSDRLEPGAVEELLPGEDISFATPPSMGDYEQSTRVALRKVAVGWGITYEALTNDYSQVNFSSSKMAAIRMNKNVENWRWNYFITQFCDGVWEWFIDAAFTAGIATKKHTATWTPPKRDLLDPKIENEADNAEVRNGFSSWDEIVISRGKDPDEVRRQIAESNKKFDKLNIILDSDPRKMMKTGIMQQPTATELSNENGKT